MNFAQQMKWFFWMDRRERVLADKYWPEKHEIKYAFLCEYQIKIIILLLLPL